MSDLLRQGSREQGRFGCANQMEQTKEELGRRAFLPHRFHQIRPTLDAGCFQFRRQFGNGSTAHFPSDRPGAQVVQQSFESRLSCRGFFPRDGLSLRRFAEQLPKLFG
jgi:hypothetical protein